MTSVKPRMWMSLTSMSQRRLQCSTASRDLMEFFMFTTVATMSSTIVNPARLRWPARAIEASIFCISIIDCANRRHFDRIRTAAERVREAKLHTPDIGSLWVCHRRTFTAKCALDQRNQVSRGVLLGQDVDVSIAPAVVIIVSTRIGCNCKNTWCRRGVEPQGECGINVPLYDGACRGHEPIRGGETIRNQQRLDR